MQPCLRLRYEWALPYLQQRKPRVKALSHSLSWGWGYNLQPRARPRFGLLLIFIIIYQNHSRFLRVDKFPRIEVASSSISIYSDRSVASANSMNVISRQFELPPPAPGRSREFADVPEILMIVYFQFRNRCSLVDLA